MNYAEQLKQMTNEELIEILSQDSPFKLTIIKAEVLSRMEATLTDELDNNPYYLELSEKEKISYRIGVKASRKKPRLSNKEIWEKAFLLASDIMGENNHRKITKKLDEIAKWARDFQGGDKKGEKDV